ncbi:MAG: hypothetical protein ACOCYV_00480 [Planctomycetota bacterium]
MARRNAHQTVFATFAAVIGVLITFKLMSMVGRNRSEEVFSGELPDIELRHVSPQELFEEFAAGKDRPGFRRQAHAPQTWDDISLRVYWHGGEKLQVMDCLIDGNEIEHIAKGFFTNPGRRRPVDDLPPDWFPWERDADDSPWRVPDWWAPNPAGVGSYYVTPIEGGYLFGAYLHYHPATGRAHLWQFKRRGIQPPPLSRGELVVDYLASNISNTLRQDQHPHIEGWYDAPGLDPRTLGLPEEMIPPGVTRIDALLFPWKKEPQRFRYFMRIHGLDSARAYPPAGQALGFRPAGHGGGRRAAGVVRAARGPALGLRPRATRYRTGRSWPLGRLRCRTRTAFRLGLGLRRTPAGFCRPVRAAGDRRGGLRSRARATA